MGRELKTDEEITAAARALQEKGARNVLVSMAGNGALLVDEHGEVHRIDCPKGKVVNSVGAGDSMVAGFVAGYLQSGSYEQALRLGTACGSATAFSLGLATKEKNRRIVWSNLRQLTLSVIADAMPPPPKWEVLTVIAMLMVLPRALPSGELDAKRPERVRTLR